jgi:hypothetical protein
MIVYLPVNHYSTEQHRSMLSIQRKITLQCLSNHSKRVEKKSKSNKGNHPGQVQKKHQHEGPAQPADADDTKNEEQKAILSSRGRDPHRIMDRKIDRRRLEPKNRLKAKVLARIRQPSNQRLRSSIRKVGSPLSYKGRRWSYLPKLIQPAKGKTKDGSGKDQQ